MSECAQFFYITNRDFPAQKPVLHIHLFGCADIKSFLVYLSRNVFISDSLNQDGMAEQVAPQGNHLLVQIDHVQAQIVGLKEKAKKFYFQVLLSLFKCPKCDGEMEMTGVSQCSCKNGHTLDPTLVFQKSSCCSARLVRKTFHYVCFRCKRINPSRFLFDERIFDQAYFSQMMKKHRDRIQKRKEMIIKQMQEAKSDELTILDEPYLESLPGLLEDLDQFVKAGKPEPEDSGFEVDRGFTMTDYRSHILSALDCGSRFFSSISNLGFDTREDRAFRFVTLIFMQHDSEVEITQYDGDLLIERR